MIQIYMILLNNKRLINTLLTILLTVKNMLKTHKTSKKSINYGLLNKIKYKVINK